MRVTQNMIINNMLRNLNDGLRRMERYNDQLSSGKRLRVPSDHPGDVTRAMYFRSQLEEVTQYTANGKEALSWLEATDSALDNAGAVLARARELAVYGATGSLSPTDRAAIAEEVATLIDHLAQVANSALGGRYLFGGHKTNTPPYVRGPIGPGPGWVYDGDQGSIEMEIAPEVKLAVNVVGSDVFDGMLDVLHDLHQALLANDGERVGGEILGELDGQIDRLLRVRAEVGARTHRVEAGLERLADLEINVSRMLSETEDVDVARTIMELKMEENVYRLALASTARIIQPTLLDFLRP